MDRPFQIFDAYQLDGYGGEKITGDGFTCRFYTSKKGFWTNYYIPYGPICENYLGFKNFVEYFNHKSFCKIHLDLPVIFNSELEHQCVQLLDSTRYKPSKYIHDNETLFVTKETFCLNKRNMRYVRQGLREYDVQIKSTFSDDELHEIHKLMEFASSKLGYNLKAFAALKEVSQKGFTSVAYDRTTGKIEGFLMGYTVELVVKEGKEPVKERSKKMLQLIFTGLYDAARDAKLGFALHNELFNYCFDTQSFDIIDFHGASRTQNRTYIEFKKMFGGEFRSNAGSFKKIKIL